jgi:hypothetical protein
VQVHIVTKDRIFEATLTVSDQQRYDKSTLSDFSSINDINQTTCPALGIPTSLYTQKMMNTSNYPTKSPAHTESVPNSNGSFISVFDPNNQSSNSTDTTTLEPSFELPIEDTLFLQDLLNNTQLNSQSDNDDWLNDFPINSIDQLITSDPTMTFKEVPDISMEDEYHHIQHVGMTTDIPATPQDDATRSSADSTSDSERDDINRRGLKKSGGPVRKLARFGNKQVVKYSDEYHDRRIKNNEAVKKSRLKAKEKQKETEGRMTQLAAENRTLNDRVELLMKELQVLKSLYKELNHDLPAAAVKALERVNVR